MTLISQQYHTNSTKLTTKISENLAHKHFPLFLLGDSKITLKTLESNSIDFILTSPPYDNLRDYKGFSFDFESIADELFRVLKNGGVMVWIVGDAVIKGSESLSSFRQALYFQQLGRKFIGCEGCEIEKSYVDFAKERINSTKVENGLF